MKYPPKLQKSSKTLAAPGLIKVVHLAQATHRAPRRGAAGAVAVIGAIGLEVGLGRQWTNEKIDGNSRILTWRYCMGIL